MRRAATIIAAIVLSAGPSFAQTSDDTITTPPGHYWVNGIDVAYGSGGHGQDSYRYMLGSDGKGTRIFYQPDYARHWFESNYLPSAKKVVSYKTQGYGNYALWCDYGGDIYGSDDGGLSSRPWGYMSDTYNHCYTTIEILNGSWGGGRIVFVGCEAHEKMPTAYYTTDFGYTWSRLGGDQENDPMYGITVNDIESMASGELVAATNDGLFRHGIDYDSSWERAAFEHENVTALENVDVGVSQQICAVGSEGSRLYYTADAWRSDIRELKAGDESFGHEVRDITAIYWRSSNISCYVASDAGGYLLAFNESDPSTARLTNLATVDTLISDGEVMTGVDYYCRYDLDSLRASILMSSTSGVYGICEYRSDPARIDSITVSRNVEGTFWVGEIPDESREAKR